MDNLNLKVFSYYPHYGGTLNAKTDIPALLVAFILTAPDANEAAELVEDFEDERGGGLRGAVWGLNDILCGQWNPNSRNTTLASLKKKGYIAELWEEGCIYLAEPTKHREASNEMWRKVADASGEDEGFDDWLH